VFIGTCKAVVASFTDIRFILSKTLKYLVFNGPPCSTGITTVWPILGIKEITGSTPE